MQMIQHMKSDFFQTHLQTRGNIALAIGKHGSWLTRWTKATRKLIGKYASNNRRALVPRHLDTLRMVTKIMKLQTELTVFLGANDVAKLVHESRPAKRSQAHDFPFVAVVRKAEKLRRGGVDDAGRMRILDLPQHLDRVPFSTGPHRGNEISKAVD